MELIHSGAYIAERFDGNIIDHSKWQFLHDDPSMQVNVGKGYLRIHGLTSLSERTFSGLSTCNLYPADVILITEISMPCSYDQEGTFGFVTHLCSCLIGNRAHTLTLPDNNCEITFGRMKDKLGWFFWWLNHGKEKSKWSENEDPLKPFGNEDASFRTVRLSYDNVTHEMEGAVMDKGKWVRIGRPVRFMKLFSSIELKIDAQAKNLNLDLRFRNCRLFPNPKRNPVKVFVGNPLPLEGVVVKFSDLKGHLLRKSTVDSDGLASLCLPSGANFPLSGKLEVYSGRNVVDGLERLSDGVDGIYPGDFYGSSPR